MQYEYKGKDNRVLLLTDRLHPYIMVCHQASGPCYITKTVFLCDEIPVEKIRLSWDHLIFTMGIPISIRPHLYIEMAPKVGYNRVCLISWYTINGEVTLGIMCLGAYWRGLSMVCDNHFIAAWLKCTFIAMMTHVFPKVFILPVPQI